MYGADPSTLFHVTNDKESNDRSETSDSENTVTQANRSYSSSSSKKAKPSSFTQKTQSKSFEDQEIDDYLDDVSSEFSDTSSEDDSESEIEASCAAHSAQAQQKKNTTSRVLSTFSSQSCQTMFRR